MRSRFLACVLVACGSVSGAAGEEPAARTARATEASTAKPAAFDIAALDRSVDPCVDFYQFACGSWRKANPIPPDQTRWGRFNELAERNREELHAILESAKDPSHPRSPVEARVGDYYAACMDEATIEAQGRKPLEPVLAAIASVQSRADLFRLLGENEARALPALFRFGSAPDMHDSTRTIATIGQGGLSLPDRDDYLKDDAKSKEKRERFLEHAARMLQLAGEDAESAKVHAQTVLRIETGLAAAHMDRTELRDPKNRDNLMSVAELEQLAPGFDFAAYFPATGAPAFERLNVSSRKFFAGGRAGWSRPRRSRTGRPTCAGTRCARPPPTWARPSCARTSPSTASSCGAPWRSSRVGSAACRRPTAASGTRWASSTSRGPSAPRARRA